jgi:hypothetical protein
VHSLGPNLFFSGGECTISVAHGSWNELRRLNAPPLLGWPR